MSQLRVIEADVRMVGLAAGLFDAYRQFYGQRSDLEAARQFLTVRLANRQSIVLLAVADEPAVGLGFAQVYPTFSSIHMRPVWIINDLFVAHEARRRGVGRLLLEATATMALAAGACRVVFSSAKENEAAKSLYEVSGYRLDRAFDHYERSLNPA